MESQKPEVASNATARVFKILECLSSYESLDIDRIARKTKIPLSTALRFIKTCVDAGYVILLANKEYQLTTKLFEIGNKYMEIHKPMLKNAHPHLRELCYKTDETVHLGILSGRRVLYVDKIDSPLMFRLNSYVGYLSDVHCTAMGKVLTAWMEDTVKAAFINTLTLNKYTKNTITSKKKFREELELVKTQGFAEDNEEQEYHLHCISVPIFDNKKQLYAAISLSLPTMRVEEGRKKSLLLHLRSCVKKIEKEL